MLTYNPKEGYIYHNLINENIIVPVDKTIKMNNPSKIIFGDNGDYDCAFIVDNNKVHIYYHHWVYDVYKWSTCELPNNYVIQSIMFSDAISVMCCQLKDNILTLYTISDDGYHNMDVMVGISIMNVDMYKNIDGHLIIFYIDGLVDIVECRSRRISLNRTCMCDYNNKCDCDWKYSDKCDCDANGCFDIESDDDKLYEKTHRDISYSRYKLVKLNTQVVPNNYSLKDCIYTDIISNIMYPSLRSGNPCDIFMMAKGTNITGSYYNNICTLGDVLRGNNIINVHFGNNIIHITYEFDGTIHVITVGTRNLEIEGIVDVCKYHNAVLYKNCGYYYKPSPDIYSKEKHNPDSIKVIFETRKKHIVYEYNYDCDVVILSHNIVLKKWDPSYYKLLNNQQKAQVLFFVLYNRYCINYPYKIPKYLFHNIVSLFIKKID